MKMKNLFALTLATVALVMGFSSCEKKEVDEVKLMRSEVSLKVGEKLKVAVVKQSGDITWTSASEAVATVDAEGTITGVAEGNTVVTATVGSASATVKVTVTAGGAEAGVPEVAKPEDGYVTIVINIPAGSECHGIAFKGCDNGTDWSAADTYLKGDGSGSAAEDYAKFEAIEGAANWYKATYKLGTTPWGDNSDILLAGKICLVYAGDGNWQGQASEWEVNEDESSAAWSKSNDGNLQINGSGVVYVDVKGWQKSECVDATIEGTMVFVPAEDDVIPEGKMIFTGNFTEKDWGNSDREMVKGEDGKYTYTGTLEKGMQFKVFVLTEELDDKGNKVQKWAVGDNMVLPEDATFPYEFTMRFTEETPAE